MTHRVLYLDHNATSPLHPAAREAWLECVADGWHNPSGLYPRATAARERLEDARDRLGDLLDVEPTRIVFTSGATAAANLVARFVAKQAPPQATVVTSGVEHPCVDDSLAAAFGGRVVSLAVDASGMVSLESVATACASPLRPSLVAVMAASNETGVLQPWAEVAARCHGSGIPLLCDASQWFGKLSAAGFGMCPWVIGSSHKFGGPRGTGFLVVPEGVAFRGDLGGPQEQGRHAGTEDTAGVVAMVAALEARERELAPQQPELESRRRAAERRLRHLLPQAVIVGERASRLWNTLAVVIPAGDGKRMVGALGRAGIAASTGSACSSGYGAPSRTLSAIGAEPLGLQAADLRGLVRLSAGPDTTLEQWLDAVEQLAAIAKGEAGPPKVSLTDPPSRRPPAPERQP